MVVKNTGYRQGQHLQIGIANRNRISQADSHQFRSTHRQVCFSGFRQPQGFFTAVEMDKILHLFIHTDQIHISCLAVKLQLYAALIEEAHFLGRTFQRFSESLLLLRSLTFGKIDLHIEQAHFFILDIGDINNGIPHTEACQQQCSTAADTHQHHQKTLMVAQNIAQHHLVQEAELVPERQFFQEYLFAGSWCFGPDQLRWHFPQGSVTAVPSHQRRYQDIGRCHAQTQRPVDQQFHIRGDVENDAVSIPQQFWEEAAAHGYAQCTAKDSCASGIGKVLAHDLITAVTQGFQCADLGAFFLYHTGHGGNAHQCRDQQEEHRQHHRNTGNDVGIAVQCQITGICVPGQRIHAGRFHGIDGVSGICQFCFRFLQLCQTVSKFRLGLCLAGFIFCPGFVQLCPGICKGSLSIFQFLLLGLEFFFAFFQLQLAGCQLCLSRCKLAFCLQAVAFQLFVTVADLLLGIFQGCFCSQQLFVLRSQFLFLLKKLGLHFHCLAALGLVRFQHRILLCQLGFQFLYAAFITQKLCQLQLSLGHADLGLGQGDGQLQLGQALFDLCKAVFNLGQTIFQLRKSLFDLR